MLKSMLKSDLLRLFIALLKSIENILNLPSFIKRLGTKSKNLTKKNPHLFAQVRI